MHFKAKAFGLALYVIVGMMAAQAVPASDLSGYQPTGLHQLTIKSPSSGEVITVPEFTISGSVVGSVMVRVFINGEYLDMVEPGSWSVDVDLVELEMDEPGSLTIQAETVGDNYNYEQRSITVTYAPDEILPTVTMNDLELIEDTVFDHLPEKVFRLTGTAEDPQDPDEPSIDPSGLKTVQVRINAGAWQTAEPVDDSLEEWKLDTTYEPGRNWIEAQSIDNAGNVSEFYSMQINYAKSEKNDIVMAIREYTSFWHPGTARHLVWQCSTFESGYNVNLELWRNGQFVTLITGTAEDDGSGWYAPTMAEDSIVGGGYTIRACSQWHSAMYAESAEFTIQPPIYLFSPRPGQRLDVGSTVTLDWQTDLIEAGDFVAFELWSGGIKRKFLGTDRNEEGYGQDEFEVTEDYPLGDDYEIRCVSAWKTWMYYTVEPLTIGKRNTVPGGDWLLYR